MKTAPLMEFCQDLVREIDAMRAKANCPTTSYRDAHDMLTYIGGLERALEMARVYLVVEGKGK